jgi:hypothetical protein
MIIRKTAFFLTLDEAKAFETDLRANGHRDIVVVLAKNQEDCAKYGAALARVQGAHVNWTENGHALQAEHERRYDGYIVQGRHPTKAGDP